MNYALSIRIASRYFISAKSHGVVNVISGISVAGVAIATAAIVIVLSVFNGFSHLTHSRFSAVDPDIMLVPVSGKVIPNADSLSNIVGGIKGIAAASPTLTERGLIISDDDHQLGIVFKGVGADYGNIVGLDSITNYSVTRPAEDTIPGTSVAVGIASQMKLMPGSHVELYTLRRLGRINPVNPSSAFFSAQLGVDRIISIDQMEFDTDHMIIPLDVARGLLQYDNDEASAIEVTLASDANIRSVMSDLGKQADKNGLILLNKEQQHAESYRMISIEKWVTFAMLIFILIIAAFNIISTLSLMVIEKRDNMQTLRFLGATHRMVRSVFSIMGALITIIGGIIGIVIGVALSLAQQYGGYIKLNGDQSKLSISEYPVHVVPSDILAVLAIVFIVALLASLTTKIFINNALDADYKP